MPAAMTAEYERDLTGLDREPRSRVAEAVRSLLLDDNSSDIGETVDYPLCDWHIAGIATDRDGNRWAADLARMLDRRILSVPAGEGLVWIWWGGRRRLRSECVKEAAGAFQLGERTLSLGEPGVGLEGWRSSHRQARAAFAVSRHCPDRIVCYADIALVAIALQDQLLVNTLADTYLAPLRDGHGVLRNTLGAYLRAGGSVSSSSAALGVARSTVERRLRTIEGRLGRSLRRPSPELEVALRVHELLGVGVKHSETRADW